MTAKEYLQQLDTLRDEIESTNLALEKIFTEAQGIKAITYDKDRVQVSPSNHAENFMIKLAELGDEYAQMQMQYKLERDKRIAMINALSNPIHVRILRKRYIDGKTFEEIAVALHYTYRHVTRLHGSALQEFAAKYKDVLLCPNDLL
jgi:DNA-directed RNA polymerase specialized sigma subunit